METMTLLKQQLQRPKRNETKFMEPVHSSMVERADVELNQFEIPYALRKHARGLGKSFKVLNKDFHSQQELNHRTSQKTDDNNELCEDMSTKHDEVVPMSNFPFSSAQPKYSPHFQKHVHAPGNKNDEDNISLSEGSQGSDVMEHSNFKTGQDHAESSLTLSRFYPNQAEIKTVVSSLTNLPQDLSQSFPPYHNTSYHHNHHHHHNQNHDNQNHHHNNNKLSWDGKLQTSSPISSDSLSLLSPLSTTSSPPSSTPLSTPLSTQVAASSSSSASSSISNIPFHLYSFQSSSLFPIAFPTPIRIPQTNSQLPNFLERDTTTTTTSTTSSPPSHLPLTPPSPSYPTPLHHPLHPPSHHHHSPPSPSNKTHLNTSLSSNQHDTNFLSRKRRHSTAPILVDTNIPFSTYLQNLTKTLQASAKSKSITNNPAKDQLSPNSSKPTTTSGLAPPQEPDSSSSDDFESKPAPPFYHNRHNDNNDIRNKQRDDTGRSVSGDNIKGCEWVGGDNIKSPANEVVDDNRKNKGIQKDVKVVKNNNSDDEEDEENDVDENEDEINIEGNDEIIENDDDDDDENDDDDDYDEKNEGDIDNMDDKEGENECVSTSPKNFLEQSGKLRSEFWNTEGIGHRRERRFRRHRNVSEMYLPMEKYEGRRFKDQGQELDSMRHPLSAPVYTGVTPPVVFPHPFSLFPQYSGYHETSAKSQIHQEQQQQQQQQQHQQQLRHHHHHQQQQQQQQQQLPRHVQQQTHHHLSMGLSSIPIHPSHRSPPPLLPAQLTSPGSQYNSSHLYSKLFHSLGSTTPNPSPRFPDMNTSVRASVTGVTVPGTSSFFTSQFLGLGGLGMRRSSSDKPPPVKKYKCDVCQKAFSRSNTLVTHKRIHTGDKPFKCEICGRAFRQPGNLTRHRLTHTTHKPYVCHVCGKAFNRASNLNTHIRTHNSFRQFGCGVCPKPPFGQRSEFNGDRSYKCDVCGRCFSHSTTLLAHRRIHLEV